VCAEQKYFLEFNQILRTFHVLHFFDLMPLWGSRGL
jgi:hypothetical protein